MDLGIAGRVAIVTGGSRGLGRQAAISLAREGVNVVIVARGADQLEQTASELRGLGVEALPVVADVAVPDTAATIVEAAVGAFGGVDILVSNAGGRAGGQTLEETTDEDLLHGFQLNLLGGLRLSRLVVPGMRERSWGRIVTISSIYGREHGGTFGYMACKAALIAATKHLALQVVRDGILVNSVAPGSVLFPGGSWDRFTQGPKEVVDEFIRVNLPMGKFGWPEPVGDLVAYLSSERIGFLTGACVNIDGGQSHSLI